ncbi:TPM domain-containing protein, partial [Agromyces mediolanus]|nr:TPM domain-containing protein [Agromyces mediolanus]
GGALAIAESQLGVARALVERGRGLVGAGARTRLAEAERQLVIARQEPDPVAALDAARRAAARAADAEALASWDAGAGRR